MDDQMESSVPPGFRFHPTEEELVDYYLKRKTHSLKIELDAIVDIDLYKMEPWDIQERCKVGYYEQSDWYFFNHKDRKYPTGTRTNRATAAGFWKATGRDKAVLSKNRIIGMRKTLVFYNGRAPNGRKSDWIMHEYRLQTSEHGPPQEEGWVVCRAFKKPSPNQRTQDYLGWNINHVYNMGHHSNHSCLHQHATTQHTYMHQQQIITSDPPVNNFQHQHPLMPSVVSASASVSAPDHHENNYGQLNLLHDQLPQQLDKPPTLSPTNNFPTKVDHVDQENTSTIDWTNMDGLLGPQVNDTTITTSTTTSFSSVFPNDNFSIPSVPQNYVLQQVDIDIDIDMDGSIHDHGINSISHFLGCFPDL